MVLVIASSFTGFVRRAPSDDMPTIDRAIGERADNPSPPYSKRLSTVLAGQKRCIEEVDDGIWLVSFMQSDLGYIGLEQKPLQPLDNPFGRRLSPMSWEFLGNNPVLISQGRRVGTLAPGVEA
jgi:hypothetical protein